MKKISILLIAFVITAGAKAQNMNYHFISQLHQSVKYDSVNQAYFVDKQINNVATISVTDNAISFINNEGTTSYITTIRIESNQLQSLENKTSFSVNGIDAKTGRKVKLGFWFIGEDLDEVNYIDETSQVAIGYKDLSMASTADAIAIDNAVAKAGK